MEEGSLGSYVFVILMTVVMYCLVNHFIFRHDHSSQVATSCIEKCKIVKSEVDMKSGTSCLCENGARFKFNITDAWQPPKKVAE